MPAPQALDMVDTEALEVAVAQAEETASQLAFTNAEDEVGPLESELLDGLNAIAEMLEAASSLDGSDLLSRISVLAEGEPISELGREDARFQLLQANVAKLHGGVADECPAGETLALSTEEVTPPPTPQPCAMSAALAEYDDPDGCPDPSNEGLEERPEQEVAGGSRYAGQWLGDARTGHGVQVWPGGACYKGDFRRGAPHGEGVYTQPDGVVHRGQWVKGKQHGEGSEEFVDGTKYTGQYVEGAKTGRGTYVFMEGSVYDGEFFKNNMHGDGTYIWAGGQAGRKYRGQWSENLKHGKGDLSLPDGRRYMGEFVKDVKHGSGTFVWPDGRKYIGQWRNGMQHGHAQFKDAGGKLQATKWAEGEMMCNLDEPVAIHNLKAAAAANSQKSSQSGTVTATWSQKRSL